MCVRFAIGLCGELSCLFVDECDTGYFNVESSVGVKKHWMKLKKNTEWIQKVRGIRKIARTNGFRKILGGHQSCTLEFFFNLVRTSSQGMQDTFPELISSTLF